MGGKCKCPSYGPSQAYLLSFGDTMTALLAFFIVLNSLAKEQTGAKLHSGTGSFIRTLDSFGMPGLMTTARSQRAFQMEETSPLYIAADPNEHDPERNGTGPDEDADHQRVIDRERDEFYRFLQELRRMNPLQGERGVQAEVAFDILKSLPSEGSPMTKELKEALTSIGPMLRQSDYSIEIVVWATTPSETAWSRAVNQSAVIRDETIKLLNLTPLAESRLSAVGRTWIDRDLKRPAVSVTLKKLKPPTG